VPKVSIVMPVYNGERYLGIAIESVLRQTYKDFELLIINDGSTDDSAGIISKYSDSRITLIQNESKNGVSAARNAGLARANGEYVAFLDCDDVATPDRLSVQVDFLESHNEFVMIGARVLVIDENGNPTGDKWKYPASSAQIPSILLFQNYFTQSAVCARTSCLVQHWYRTEYPPAEDYELWLRMARMGSVWNLPKCLLHYRKHPGGMSTVRADALERSVVMILKKQINELGLKVTPGEINMHRRVGEILSRDWTFEQLDELEAWLLKLRDANSCVHLYPADIFIQQLGERWYAACSAAVTTLPGVVRKFSGSTLSQALPDLSFNKLRIAILSIVK